MNDMVKPVARHALGWLVIANAVGLWLSLLLLFPGLQRGEWTYGRWIPVHLNGQLYGWTAMPLVAWLVWMYEIDRRSARAAAWAWSAALALGCASWLGGGSSGKIFLDWKGGALAGLLAAMGVLWLILLGGRKSVWLVLGLIVLAAVPVMMAMAASPHTYPPVDPTTGGPTGSSLLGSTLGVVALMLILPASVGLRCHFDARGKGITLGFFGISAVVFAVTEWLGGSHFDYWQIGAMLMLVPWVVLLPRWWRRYVWPKETSAWRTSMLLWWALLVVSGVTAFLPGVLDRLKFTQGLVAHSHLAMAGFTTSFCAVILSTLGVRLGSTRDIVVWNLAAFGMVVALSVMGWLEGAGNSWMIGRPAWRTVGLAVRTLCGAVMVAVAAKWWWEMRKEHEI